VFTWDYDCIETFAKEIKWSYFSVYVPVPRLYWADAGSIGPVQARYWQLSTADSLKGITRCEGSKDVYVGLTYLVLVGHQIEGTELLQCLVYRIHCIFDINCNICFLFIKEQLLDPDYISE